MIYTGVCQIEGYIKLYRFPKPCCVYFRLNCAIGSRYFFAAGDMRAINSSTDNLSFPRAIYIGDSLPYIPPLISSQLYASIFLIKSCILSIKKRLKRTTRFSYRRLSGKLSLEKPFSRLLTPNLKAFAILTGSPATA